MNKPYFEVGEEVILESATCPELNGDYFIEHMLPKGVWPNPYKSDSLIEVISPAAYKLMGIAPVKPVLSGYFGQPSLKKKHKPSGKSFQELITNLQPTEKTL